MKSLLIKGAPLLYIFIVVSILSCNKSNVRDINPIINPPPPTVIPCNNRPIINATLVPIGLLSEARKGLVSGTAGSKIFFAGGIKIGAYSSRVDIYDTITRIWSTAELTIAERHGMTVATVGTKIIFAGGEDGDMGASTSRVDIYDVSTNTWSTAELSQSRSYLAAATLGNRVFFAGGAIWNSTRAASSVVDIYNNSTNTWSTANLSQERYELSATTVGNKIYFAGGTHSMFSVSKTIDIFNSETNSWSVWQLAEVKTAHASIAVANKIFWAGGVNTSYWNGYNLSNQVEIKDLITGASSLTCITPKSSFKAVVSGDNIIFFTGNLSNTFSGTHFEVYNTITDQWSTAVLNNQINDATIISVNNTVYVAGGTDGGNYIKQVWKLEF